MSSLSLTCQALILLTLQLLAHGKHLSAAVRLFGRDSSVTHFSLTDNIIVGNNAPSSLKQHSSTPLMPQAFPHGYILTVMV